MRTFKSYAITTSHPTVTATAPAPTVSDRYTFIPTSRVVEALQSRGWEFDHGTARRTRIPERAAFATHVLRFSHPELPALVDSRPQIVIVNSHGAGTAFQLSLGAFRIACANGLVLASEEAGTIRLRHVGLTTEQVLQAADRLLESAPERLTQIARWQDIRLTPSAQELLAQRAAEVRWPGARVDIEDLLRVRRDADSSNDLWHTFHRVQEAVIRGGVRVTRNVDGSEVTRRAGAIRGPLRDIAINRTLWGLAEECAEASFAA